MKVFIFDTETNGLIKGKYAKPYEVDLFPYVCQLSWLVYDDKTNDYFTKDYIIKLPDGIEIPKCCSDIHGITTEQMRKEGVDISGVLQEFTSDWMKCQILIAHNLNFDNRIMQAEYNRNWPINWLGRHRKIEYCTMKEGKKFTKLMRPSKFGPGFYQKPPKLIELHEELFKTTPKNLHDSLIDVLVCFRCFHKMIYNKDVVDENTNKKLYDYYNLKCGL